MQNPLLSAHAAIHYAADAFDITKPHLMGRQVAGESFLKGLLRHTSSGTISIYGDPPGHRDFLRRFGKLVSAGVGITPIKRSELHRVAEVGTLFMPYPGLSTAAWQRRFVGNRAYSLCGITHTTASHSVMEAIETLCIAPVQAWDALICTSEAVRRTVQHVLAETKYYLRNRIGAEPPVEVATPVIPLGLDTDAFAQSASVRQELRERLGVGNGDILVLFLGRLTSHAKANPLPLYQVLQLAARKAGRRVHLLMAGWFPNEEYRTAFRTGATRYAPNIHYHNLDAREPVARHSAYSAADIFVSLSDNVQETFGLTPLEAMAAGVPVVVSDWDGYRETVRHGLDGFVIPTVVAPPGSGRDLARRYAIGTESYDFYIGHAAQFAAAHLAQCADNLATLIGDDELRRKMGHSARERARSDYDWSVIIPRYHSLWQELAKCRRESPEIAPAAPDRPARPAWDDPFRSFAHYASRKWDDEMTIAPGLNGESPESLLAHPFASLSRQFLCSPKEVSELIRIINTGNQSVSVSAILAHFPPQQSSKIRRTIVWMAKFGLVHFPT